MHTIDELEKASLKWPEEVREQLHDRLESFLPQATFDWPNATWKKIDFNLAKDISKFSLIQRYIINGMIYSYQLSFVYGGVIDGVKRHNNIKEYLLKNGTWPKSIIAVTDRARNRTNAFSTKHVDGWTIADGNHRLAQLVYINSILTGVSKLDAYNAPILKKQLQDVSYVTQINAKHEMWIGS